jgi:hypothetical protein
MSLFKGQLGDAKQMCKFNAVDGADDTLGQAPPKCNTKDTVQLILHSPFNHMIPHTQPPPRLASAFEHAPDKALGPVHIREGQAPPLPSAPDPAPAQIHDHMPKQIRRGRNLIAPVDIAFRSAGFERDEEAFWQIEGSLHGKIMASLQVPVSRIS